MSRVIRPAVVAFSLCCLAFGAQAADKTRVVNEGGIGDEWMLKPGTTLATPGYTSEMKDSGDNVCVAIGYSINKDGKTGDFAVLKTYSSREGATQDDFDQYASAGAGAVSQWQFQPKPEVSKPRRTVTVATMTFRGKKGGLDPTLAARCKIDDLAAVIQDANHKTIDQSRLKRDMEAQQRASAAGNSMINNPGQSTIPTTGRR